MRPEIESPQGKYVDPAVHRKSKNIQNEKKIRYIEGFPIFTLIEFNIYGACNRDCSFCPVSNLDVYTNKYEGFSISLFTKIIRDLYDLSYDGKLLFSAFSEPFLNKDLPSLVAIVKGMLPNASLEIVSNGDVFKKRTKKLLDVIAAGVDTVSVSIYDGPEETAEFKKIIEDLGLSSDQIILRRRYYTKEKKIMG